MSSQLSSTLQSIPLEQLSAPSVAYNNAQTQTSLTGCKTLVQDLSLFDSLFFWRYHGVTDYTIETQMKIDLTRPDLIRSPDYRQTNDQL